MQIDGIESKEIKFFGFENLPHNISPTNKSFIEDLQKMIKGEYNV